MKTDLSNFSGWVIYEKGKIVATYDKENFHRYYDQEEIRILQQRIDKAIEYIKKENEWVKNSNYKLLKTEVLLAILGERK